MSSAQQDVTVHVRSAVPIDRCVESPTNPRRETNDAALGELTESIRQHGVLQPIVVRTIINPDPDRDTYEVVCGSRRLRAALAAGLEEIPATVLALTDEEARVIQIEENVQREDLSPIDEAEGYQQLINLGRSVEEIAANCHKSKATIYGRLQLLNLPDEAVAAMRAGDLAPSIATLVGRIPVLELRKLALEEILEGRFGDGPMTYDQAKVLIRDSYMNSLVEAPFDPANSDLLEDVGACTHCPNRTGTNESLFGDLVSDGGAGPDVCVNPPCYARKKAAHAEAQLQAAKLQGLHVLPQKQSEKLFRGDSAYLASAKYIDPEDTCPNDPKRRKWKTLLGNEAPEAVVAVDGAGVVRHLVPRKAAVAVLEQKHEWAKPRQLQGQEGGGAAAKDRAERELREKTAVAYRDALVAAAEGDKMRTPSQGVWQAWAAVAVGNSDWVGDGDVLATACLRRGLIEAEEWDKAPPRRLTSELFVWLEKCTGAQARGLLAELTATIPDTQYGPPHMKQLVAALDEAFGIDRKAIAAAVKANIAKEKTQIEKAAKAIAAANQADRERDADPAASKPKKAGGRKRRAIEEASDVQG